MSDHELSEKKLAENCRLATSAIKLALLLQAEYVKEHKPEDEYDKGWVEGYRMAQRNILEMLEEGENGE